MLVGEYGAVGRKRSGVRVCVGVGVYVGTCARGIRTGGKVEAGDELF